jgi:lysophospholipase L1-like esterase
MKTLLCYGDSNTWGFATAPRPDDRYAPEERWPHVLAGELSAEWAVIAEGLSGRTTVHADPIEGHWLDGSAYLLPCLRSHRPLDAVAIMLGTNDLKQRFGVSAGDIAAGIGRLLMIVRQAEAGPGGAAPKMLVICPPPILAAFGENVAFKDMFAGGHEKSLKMASAYETVAREQGAAFLDAGEVIQSSAFDGIHLDLDAHSKLGRAVAAAIAQVGW